MLFLFLGNFVIVVEVFHILLWLLLLLHLRLFLLWKLDYYLLVEMAWRTC